MRERLHPMLLRVCTRWRRSMMWPLCEKLTCIHDYWRAGGICFSVSVFTACWGDVCAAKSARVFV